MLLSFWVPALLTLVQGSLLLEPHVFMDILVLPKSFGCWGHDRGRATVVQSLSVTLLIRASTRARPWSHLLWEQNVQSAKKLSHQDK